MMKIWTVYAGSLEAGSCRGKGAFASKAALVFGLLVILLLQVGSAFAASSKTVLEWNKQQGRVTADIESSELLTVLERIATATGWQVFVEPETQRRVSAKFKNVPPGEALQLLFGELNYALIPGTNSAQRLFVFRTSRQNATEMVRAPKVVAKKIPNELIVRLKPGVNVDDLARQLGAKVVGRLDKMNTYRLRFDDETATEAARSQLASNSEVGTVEDNYVYDRQPAPSGSQAGALSPSLQMRPPPDSGKIIVGLVDTAVQPLGNNLDQFILKQVSVAGGSNPEGDSPLHGTAMAETILRSLQDATKGSTSVQILPIDVYGPGETTSTFDVANGIVQAVNGGARVINLSLGSAGDSPFLHDVVRSASAANILLIGAAGNEPVAAPFYPAAYPEVNAVTAIDHGQLAPYASRGSFVTLGAPGLNVIPFESQSFAVEGTSVSSAYLSGLAAGYMEANRANTSQAQSFLQNNFGVSIRPR